MSIEFTSNNHYLQVGTNRGNIHVFTEPRSASHSEDTLHMAMLPTSNVYSFEDIGYLDNFPPISFFSLVIYPDRMLCFSTSTSLILLKPWRYKKANEKLHIISGNDSIE
jgi:hypothetical protein